MNLSTRGPLRTALTLAAVCVLFAGCAAAPSKVDPFEPWNRAMFSVHETIDGNLIKPIAEGYVKVTPEPVRTGVSNFFGNIDDLFSAINNTLQGRQTAAGNDFARVLFNSTFGILGIFDLASSLDLPKDQNDFGLTFGRWGVPDGPYFFVPLFGPTTLRDGTGTVIRAYTGPIGYLPYVPLRNSLYALGYVNVRAQVLGAEGVLDAAALDKYRFLRNAYLRSRRYQLYDGKPPPDAEE